MILSALMKKGGLAELATMTLAALATQENNQSATVAPVATVAVALTPELLPDLSHDEESKIRSWLASIEETDPNIITEILRKCRENLLTRQYLLKRSEEAPKPIIFNNHITCGDCDHFKRIEHPHLGHCNIGEPEAPAGLWDDDRHICNRWLPVEKSFRS